MRTAYHQARGEREHAICQCCGCRFTRRVADRKRGWAKCCSKSCAAFLRHSGNDQAPVRRFAGPEFDFEDIP